jgi:hypothetical protein
MATPALLLLLLLMMMMWLLDCFCACQWEVLQVQGQRRYHFVLSVAFDVPRNFTCFMCFVP